MWSHIYWLGVLGDAGSYTSAAKRLGVSKGAVSLRIAELEHVSGVALVQRTTRSVRLTEAGQALVDGTRQAFHTIEQGFDSILDLAEEIGRASCRERVCQYVLNSVGALSLKKKHT